MKFIIPHQCTFAAILFIVAGNCIEIQDGNADFRKYLEEAVENYTTWLQENQLDPSPPASSIMSDSTRGIQLDCKLSNHTVSGHSKTVTGEVDVNSNFTGNYFTMGREARNDSLCEYHGNFDCTGSLNTVYYPELGNKLPFSVQGNFSVISNNSYDDIVIRNVGVTQNYGLDLSHSWTEYEMFATQKSFQLNGQSNESLINNKYMENVTEAFAYIYFYYPLYHRNNASFPNGLLFERFVREIAQKINLTEIISNEEDLPNPYVPTPSTTTTTTTSTTTSTTTTTTTTTTSTTTPTTTTKSNAADRTVIQAGWFTALQALIIFFYYSFPSN